MVHIACFNLLSVLTTDVLHVIVDACISDEGIVKCSMIQDKLRRAQERLLNRTIGTESSHHDYAQYSAN